MAAQFLKRVAPNIETSETFVPGVRHGFCVIPLQLCDSSRVKVPKRSSLSAIPGHRQYGQIMRLVPQMLRGARKSFAGKAKFLIPDFRDKANVDLQVQAEYKTGAVWAGRTKMASAQCHPVQHKASWGG